MNKKNYKDYDFTIELRNKGFFGTLFYKGYIISEEHFLNKIYNGFSEEEVSVSIKKNIDKYEIYKLGKYLYHTNDFDIIFDKGVLDIDADYKNITLDEKETNKLYNAMKNYYGKNQKKG